MKDFIKKAWRVARWPLAVLLVLYVALVIYRIPAVGEAERAQAAVARIHSAKLTLGTVMGEHLPLPPNEEVNNATVAGVDNNQNGIRDDVELAIFKLHPDSAKIRAAELQYAMTEQMFLTEVFNTETWKAVAEEDDRAYQCISSLDSPVNLTSEVEQLVLNIPIRKSFFEKISKLITSFGLPEKELCDIDLNTLSI
jgi:hypothetical protein